MEKREREREREKEKEKEREERGGVRKEESVMETK